MYADDSRMFTAEHTSAELQKNLSEELQTNTNWVRTNKLILNIEKSKCIIFSNKNNITKVDVNLFTVEQVTSVKLLGLKLSILSWSEHID